jgi:hypothetical protein
MAAIRDEINAILGRIRLRAILLGLGAAFWLFAIGFAIATLTVWLVSLLGGIAACAILTAFFVVAALVTHLIAVVTKRNVMPLAEVVAVAAAIAAPEPDPAAPPPAKQGSPDSRGDSDSRASAAMEAPPASAPPSRGTRRRRATGGPDHQKT